MFRRNGDSRPPSEMGFEMVRTAADGSEETQVIVVQHLLDFAEDLDPLAHFCAGCPANRTGRPFGCIGQVDYPISGLAEAWLLNQLPEPTEPLVWLLLRQGIREFKYDGSTARDLREAGDTIFEERRTIYRALGEMTATSDQVFEMIFLTGNIQPNHAGVLLLFFGAITREIEAATIMNLGQMPLDERAAYDFRIVSVPDDDDLSTGQIKALLEALFLAWRLNVQLLLDV